MLITSSNNKNVILWSKLKQSKYQKQYQKFIIEERLIIDEAIKADLNLITISLENSGIESDYVVTDNVMRKLSFNKSLNDIIAIVDFFNVEAVRSDKIVYLDNVQDPGNVGTIIRTAYAFGYEKIILSNGVSKYNHKLISASKGAIFHVDIEEAFDLEQAKKLGYTIYGTIIDESSKDLDSAQISDKSIVVFGNEGSGISDSVLSWIDEKIYIEMNNFDSLNVGVTAGIVLYHFR